MSMMHPRQKDGHGRVYMRDGGFFIIHWSEVESLRDAWTAGLTFHEARGVYGQTITVKLAEVNGLTLFSQAAITAARQDDLLTEKEQSQEQEYYKGETT